MQVRPSRHGRHLRAALHLAGVSALAGGAVLLSGAPGHAAASARPDSYGGDATASAFHYVADRVPGVSPVSDAFHTEIPWATTSLDSSGSASASAAPLYPGAGPLGVPALICQFAAPLCGSPFPSVPKYPFIATASYPTTPDDTATYSAVPPLSGGGVTFAPNVAEAHARQDRVESLTESASLGVTSAVSADSAVAHSTQHFEGDTLVVLAESTVKGLDLGSGQLHVDQLRSVATARVDGDKVTVASSSTTLSGATVAGHAVTIDTSGIHVVGQDDGGAAQDQVNAALANLAAQGVDVRLLAPTKQAKDGAASASTGGLLITFTQDVNLPTPPQPPPPPPVCIPGATCLPGAGVPAYNGTYFGSVTVGGAGVVAFATPAEPIDFPPFVSTGFPPPPSASSPGAVAAAVLPGQPGTVSVGTSAPRVASNPAHQGRANLLGLDLTGKRLRLLALVLLGYPLLVLLAAPGRRSRNLRNRPENVAL